MLMEHDVPDVIDRVSFRKLSCHDDGISATLAAYWVSAIAVQQAANLAA